MTKGDISRRRNPRLSPIVAACDGGRIGTPVTGGGLLPFDDDGDIDAEGAGEDRGQQFDDELEPAGRAGFHEPDAAATARPQRPRLPRSRPSAGHPAPPRRPPGRRVPLGHQPVAATGRAGHQRGLRHCHPARHPRPRSGRPPHRLRPPAAATSARESHHPTRARGEPPSDRTRRSLRYCRLRRPEAPVPSRRRRSRRPTPGSLIPGHRKAPAAPSPKGRGVAHLESRAQRAPEQDRPMRPPPIGKELAGEAVTRAGGLLWPTAR